MQKLCKLDGPIRWIRFLYAYPESITEELIEVVKNNDKICNYFDIPLQHFSDKVLKKMNRKSDSKSMEKLIEKLRREIPDVILRTTMLVGFPGETEEDFEELLGFMKKLKFEKLGAFSYSREEGTPAYKLPNQIHYATKKRRWKTLMEEQEKISEEKLQEKVGKVYEVLVDSLSENGKQLVTRSYMDIPDEDSVIYIQNLKNVKVGDFVKCQITDVRGYDFLGKIVD